MGGFVCSPWPGQFSTEVSNLVEYRWPGKTSEKGVEDIINETEYLQQCSKRRKIL